MTDLKDRIDELRKTCPPSHVHPERGKARLTHIRDLSSTPTANTNWFGTCRHASTATGESMGHWDEARAALAELRNRIEPSVVTNSVKERHHTTFPQPS